MIACKTINPQLIIFEGLDNTGKSTLIDRFISILDKLGNTYKVIKADNPLKDYKDKVLTDEEAQNITDSYYNEFVNKIIDAYNRPFQFIILDRSWISEYVYGYIYRHQNKMHIVENNILYERKLIQLFKDNISLIMLTVSNPKFVINHDDGKSLSNKDIIKIKEEQRLFNRVFDLSLINDKDYYEVDMLSICDEYEYIDLLPTIVTKFLPL